MGIDGDINVTMCPTFLHREATYRLRSLRNRKHRLSTRALLDACMKLVASYAVDALADIAPEDHAKALMPQLDVVHPEDDVFLTEVLYGCCRYRGLLGILTTKLFACKVPNVQCVDDTLYTVLGYLVLIRLQELTFSKFRKFVMCQHPQKLLPFVQLVFNKNDLARFCRPDWIKIYDAKYIDELIKKVVSWNKDAADLCKRLEAKIFLVNREKTKHTRIQPFDLSQTRSKPIVLREQKAIGFKARLVPRWKEGPTPIQRALEAVCVDSRQKNAQFYSHPKNQPFQLRILERPSRLELVKAEVVSKRKLETSYIAPKARPCPKPPATEVRLTTAAVLREHALYQKQFEEEQHKIKEFEMDLRDDSEFKCWQGEMKLKLETAEVLEREFRKAGVNACDQAAADARYKKALGNREIVENIKDESQKLDALRAGFVVNLELFNRLRRENVIEGQRAVKSELIKLVESKKKRAQEIKMETTKLASACAQEHDIELAQKRELICQLRSLEAESSNIIRKFDRNATSGLGILGEMSIAELQERLELVKEAVRKEEQYRRVRIHAVKNESYMKLLEKSAFVSTMRQIARIRRLASNMDRKQINQIAASKIAMFFSQRCIMYPSVTVCIYMHRCEH